MTLTQKQIQIVLQEARDRGYSPEETREWIIKVNQAVIDNPQFAEEEEQEVISPQEQFDRGIPTGNIERALQSQDEDSLYGSMGIEVYGFADKISGLLAPKTREYFDVETEKIQREYEGDLSFNGVLQKNVANIGAAATLFAGIPTERAFDLAFFVGGNALKIGAYGMLGALDIADDLQEGVTGIDYSDALESGFDVATDKGEEAWDAIPDDIKAPIINAFKENIGGILKYVDENQPLKQTLNAAISYVGVGGGGSLVRRGAKGFAKQITDSPEVLGKVTDKLPLAERTDYSKYVKRDILFNDAVSVQTALDKGIETQPKAFMNMLKDNEVAQGAVTFRTGTMGADAKNLVRDSFSTGKNAPMRGLSENFRENIASLQKERGFLIEELASMRDGVKTRIFQSDKLTQLIRDVGEKSSLLHDVMPLVRKNKNKTYSVTVNNADEIRKTLLHTHQSILREEATSPNIASKLTPQKAEFKSSVEQARVDLLNGIAQKVSPGNLDAYRAPSKRLGNILSSFERVNSQASALLKTRGVRNANNKPADLTDLATNTDDATKTLYEDVVRSQFNTLKNSSGRQTGILDNPVPEMLDDIVQISGKDISDYKTAAQLISKGDDYYAASRIQRAKGEANKAAEARKFLVESTGVLGAASAVSVVAARRLAGIGKTFHEDVIKKNFYSMYDNFIKADEVDFIRGQKPTNFDVNDIIRNKKGLSTPADSNPNLFGRSFARTIGSNVAGAARSIGQQAGRAARNAASLFTGGIIGSASNPGNRDR